MDWNEIRLHYPNQWLVAEAIDAHTGHDGKRYIGDLIVVAQCSDGLSAFNKYKELHKKDNTREYYYLHTSREKLDISEELWIGIVKWK